MSAKRAAVFLAGALLASTGTALAHTNSHMFRLKQGNKAGYGPIVCQAQHAAQYSILACNGAHRYRIIYGPSQLRVLRSNHQVFAASPSGNSAPRAGTRTAATPTQGHLFRLKQGDRISYGPVNCLAAYAGKYSALDCVGANRYRIIYGPSELRVWRLNSKKVYKTVFAANPSGR
jgi:hypothetical protein